MKTNKYFIMMTACIFLSLFFFMKNIDSYYEEKVDITSVNEIFHAVEQNINQEHVLGSRNFSYEFSVVHKNGEIPYTTKKVKKTTFDQTVNDAIRDHETVLSYSSGAVIVYTNEFMRTQKNKLHLVLFLTGGVLLMLSALLYFHIQIRLLRPFRRLKQFAASIAHGQFDLPLPMDRHNLFGAFSESFDLMRTELKAAQEKSILLEKQKSEMVASLSHDIKTPLSTIIAVSEVMLLTETDEKKIQKLQGIERKSAEIDRLISDLFQTTLNDLSELTVDTQSHASGLLLDIISSADMLNSIHNPPPIPPCLVMFDPLRMGQVFSNIISNSYKYAESPIEIRFEIVQKEHRMLLIELKDRGTSFNPDEISKLGSKFYRGSNTKGKQGAGLGLYNCRILLARMGGHIEFSQESSGFSANIYLRMP